MKKYLLITISGISLCAIPVKAQFNTVATVPDRSQVEVSQTDADMAVPASGNPELAMVVPTDALMTELPDDAEALKRKWIDRYLSVCYPLRNIRVTSPYGHRRDPFTGKRRFHGGLDLHARKDEVLVMMEGVVVKVGQDKTSGKYVTLQHGGYTVSYCHLSKILTTKGTVVRPRDVVGITGSTGRSTGEHLHITCKLNGKSVNPMLVLDYIKDTQQECVSALAEL